MSTCIVWRGGNQLRRQVVEKTSYCVLPTAGERKRKSVDHAGSQRFRVADSLARWARLLRRKSREGGRRDVTRMARSCYIGEKRKKRIGEMAVVLYWRRTLYVSDPVIIFTSRFLLTLHLVSFFPIFSQKRNNWFGLDVRHLSLSPS